ncbi:hypothetical protein NDU88_003412 [Pleurodeles waltl]|uniref:Uncharacterized protein n=1 Tax=Pleurodeles waltl TaxID=8319 RepID=A0AAV7QCP0_PLEWA|nr:hypothetical protein NDU88_003412 [Pleurodeles waltl]
MEANSWDSTWKVQPKKRALHREEISARAPTEAQREQQQAIKVVAAMNSKAHGLFSSGKWESPEPRSYRAVTVPLNPLKENCQT